MIAHLGTRITMMLAVLDEAGNLVERKPMTVELSQLSEEQFSEARKYLNEQWQAMKESNAPGNPSH